MIQNTVAMKSDKWHLYLTAALIWGVPGGIITMKGVMAYAQLHSREWWLFAITLIVLAAFYLMFRRVVAKYSAHIEDMEDLPFDRLAAYVVYDGPWHESATYPRHPHRVLRLLLSGLGPMLLISSLRFLRRV